MFFPGSFLRNGVLCSCALLMGTFSFSAAVPGGDSAAIREIVRPLKAKVGVSAVMLDTGESVSVGDEAFYPMQSVYKFPLALSVLKRVDQEVLNLDQKVHVTRDQLPEKTWSPLRDRFPQGGEFPLKELLRFSVQEGDNNACDILFSLIGGPAAVQKDLKEWGVENMNVKYTEADTHRNHEWQYSNSARPSAVTFLFRMFDEGKILKKDTQLFLWDMMASCATGAERLKGLLPKEYVVAHKTGTGGALPDGAVSAINDAGIIVLPGGRRMAVTVFVMNSKDSPAVCEGTIASVARWLCTEWEAAGGVKK